MRLASSVLAGLVIAAASHTSALAQEARGSAKLPGAVWPGGQGLRQAPAGVATPEASAPMPVHVPATIPYMPVAVPDTGAVAPMPVVPGGALSTVRFLRGRTIVTYPPSDSVRILPLKPESTPSTPRQP